MDSLHIPSEQRSAIARRRALAFWASRTPDERRAHMRRAYEAVTYEQRQGNGRKNLQSYKATLSEEELKRRMDYARVYAQEFWASLSPK